MKLPPALLCCCLAAALAWSGPDACHAGTIRHDRNDVLYTVLGAHPDYAAVGKVTWIESEQSRLASGTLIRGDWFLTAAHVLDGTDGAGGGISFLRFHVEGQQYAAAEWYPHPQWAIAGGESNYFAGWDIALARLETPVAAPAPVDLFTTADGSELGLTGTIVGYGRTGTGLSGYGGSDDTKRAGQNAVDRVGTAVSEGSTIGGFGNERLLGFDFDNPLNPAESILGSSTPLDLEFLTAPGDSGGGLFLSVGGTMKLAGIASVTSASDGVIDSDYGDRAALTRVSQFVGWINDTIAAHSPVPGDYNGDRVVDGSDYADWREMFGTAVAAGSGPDGSGDGTVNVGDYLVWRDMMGHGAAANGAGGSLSGEAGSKGAAGGVVPEPGGLVLLLTGWPFILSRRIGHRVRAAIGSV